MYANTYCPPISMMSYYCSRVYLAARGGGGHAQLRVQL